MTQLLTLPGVPIDPGVPHLPLAVPGKTQAKSEWPKEEIAEA